MKPIRLICLWLVLCLAAMLCACTDSTLPNDKTDPTDTTDSIGSTEGLSTPERYAEAALPALPDLSAWYERAVEREQLTNALIYSQEGDLWHCWLYVGSYADGDRVEVFSDAGRLIFRATVADANASGSRSVLYFTFSCETEPDAVIEVNGEDEGILLTLADTSLKP
ncbi:MAG: hypothetical protein E7666_03485 [Ruminococcaceae bacterium]|nr:hypothetical protein [Oscillospiraceae bacterium]